MDALLQVEAGQSVRGRAGAPLGRNGSGQVDIQWWDVDGHGDEH